VRVTANEVRKKLAQFYQAENGASRAVRIDLPPGSYRAEFRWTERAPEPEPEEIAEEPIPSKPPLNRAWWLVAAAVLLAGAALPWWAGRKPAPVDPRPAPLPAAAGSVNEVRIAAGAASSYTDRTGRAWSADRYFTGGAARASAGARIYRTLEPELYRHSRQGQFRYDIPLAPGDWELRLHFAETGLSDSISAESSGEGQRLFQIEANGRPLLALFDVVADAAGANIADERVFTGVKPAPDGLLHLVFTPVKGMAMVSGIELRPPQPALRIRAGWPSGWRDGQGREWRADAYFLGGNALVRPASPARAGGEAGLYESERWGHFSYSIPVADGEYQLKLRFIEGHYGRANTGFGGAGSRRFDVYSNGLALLRNFDIYSEAGGEGRPVEKLFRHLKPTAQGKLVLTFVPVVSMASVSAIEVEREK